uniref:CRISPR type III-associated protein domain-containing protein n=1 Tax=Archaeoglobus fulgidus TaxID=2234 RepID=A0A7C3MAV8_ARCFL
MHEALKNRYVLECHLKTLSPLHIGSEKALGFGVDNPIIKIKRNGREIPVVPGSSIKGVLRAHFYRLANSGVFDKLGYRVFKGNLEEFEREFSRSDENKKKEKFKELGTLEKLFGISGLASPLRITDAEPENWSIGTRTHVKIDPRTDRAEKGKLFTVEFVEGLFKFKIVFDELASDYDDVNKFFHEFFYPLLKNGIELHFGGMKSRGYGLCEMKIEKALKFSAQNLAVGKAEELR